MNKITHVIVYDAYAHRVALVGLGGKWVQANKLWRVPVRDADHAKDVFDLVRKLGCGVAYKREISVDVDEESYSE
jgi:hypothetical protein